MIGEADEEVKMFNIIKFLSAKRNTGKLETARIEKLNAEKDYGMNAAPLYIEYARFNIR